MHVKRILMWALDEFFTKTSEVEYDTTYNHKYIADFSLIRDSKGHLHQVFNGKKMDFSIPIKTFKQLEERFNSLTGCSIVDGNPFQKDIKVDENLFAVINLSNRKITTPMGFDFIELLFYLFEDDEGNRDVDFTWQCKLPHVYHNNPLGSKLALFFVYDTRFFRDYIMPWVSKVENDSIMKVIHDMDVKDTAIGRRKGKTFRTYDKKRK
jgi:hypothetical protein